MIPTNAFLNSFVSIRKFRVFCSSLISAGLMLLITPSASAQGNKSNGKNKPDKKDADTWSAEEYSGLRGEKELQTAMASKGFAWISGSPADNEKLSVGKNAQFFGFVALRYQSGRAANRGMLGRAMFAIADEGQRRRMAEAVNAEKDALKEWWNAREAILTLLEDHLYTGLPIDREKLAELGEQFSLLNSTVAIHEAEAYAAFEDAMTPEQEELMTSWRADAESAGQHGSGVRVENDLVAREDSKQLEDLYAKAFSWLTGKPEDNEIIPIGQPAQFFGFVSIRHKSGHAASRGKISKDFLSILNAEQQSQIKAAATLQMPVVREFLESRHEFLNLLSTLRTDPVLFDRNRADQLSRSMGRLEVDAARIEAEAYRSIRASMNDDQVAAMMALRGEYVIDENQIAAMDMKQRGATLSILCMGCHGGPGQHQAGFPAPSLDGFWDRKIGTGSNYDYSTALTDMGNEGDGLWTPSLLNQFLTNPKRFAPGTKMEFQGLLNEADREALIEYLKHSR